ncbi:hypothetical protein F5X68DRAFT_200735 [Plectosphaerella plurivora]|uniref:Uncharacterized protein n=1 Tax=Plectosphaerella plurivora TaxID=936078 RepID=A0A9P9AE19_9PEZI|nr:hypothetical protein F5X68DRAFT_200735 [Plectosphaerella plurivora]
MSLWGLHAVEVKSLPMAAGIYTILAAAPAVAFVFVYIFALRHLGLDLQNPTVPLTIFLGIWALVFVVVFKS